MIEITAKQLYDIYYFIEEESHTFKEGKCGFLLEEKTIIFVLNEDGEWKPTTDLIIKA